MCPCFLQVRAFQPFPEAQRYRKLNCFNSYLKLCFVSSEILGLDRQSSAMPFPFGKSQKNPAEIVRSLKENVAYMEKLDAGDSKKCEKVSKGFFFSLSHICSLALIPNTDCWS